MQLRIFTEPQQGASYEHLLAVASCAEECGYDAFFRSDHYLRMGDGDPRPGPTDAWTTLAGLARDTSRIRLGTLLTAATFRLPGVLAVIVAQVDTMSRGRVELGLGAGWFEDEHLAFGIPFPPSIRERFDRLEEQLRAMLSLVLPRDGWRPPVLRTVATENRGITELAETIGKFRKHFEASGERQKKHVEHWKNRLVEMLESRLLEKVLGGKEGEAKLRELATAVAERKKDPFTAVSEILKGSGVEG